MQKTDNRNEFLDRLYELCQDYGYECELLPPKVIRDGATRKLIIMTTFTKNLKFGGRYDSTRNRI